MDCLLQITRHQLDASTANHAVLMPTGSYLFIRSIPLNEARPGATPCNITWYKQAPGQHMTILAHTLHSKRPVSQEANATQTGLFLANIGGCQSIAEQTTVTLTKEIQQHMPR